MIVDKIYNLHTVMRAIEKNKAGGYEIGSRNEGEITILSRIGREGGI